MTQLFLFPTCISLDKCLYHERKLNMDRMVHTDYKLHNHIVVYTSTRWLGILSVTCLNPLVSCAQTILHKKREKVRSKGLYWCVQKECKLRCKRIKPTTYVRSCEHALHYQRCCGITFHWCHETALLQGTHCTVREDKEVWPFQPDLSSLFA